MKNNNLKSLFKVGWITAGFNLLAISLALFTILSLPDNPTKTNLIVGLIAAGLLYFGGIFRVLYSYLSQNKASIEQVSSQLSEEQVKAQVLLSSMADGVFAVDKERKITLFNRAAEEMTGWTQDYAQGILYKNVLDFKNEAGKSIFDSDDPFLEVWNTGKTCTKTAKLITKNKKNIVVSMSVAPIRDTKNQITGGIATFRDITHEAEIERQRNEFVSTASHEMRTPVAAIEGYLALALNPKVSQLDPEVLPYIRKAHESALNLGQLFKNLLSVTKLEEGKLDYELKVFDIVQLAKKAVDDMQMMAEEKGLTLEYSDTPDARSSKALSRSLKVEADPSKVLEVFYNLIENAIKFTRQGGITVSVTGDREKVTVQVADTGKGIAEEDIPHLFEKFYRIVDHERQEMGGTGLGLYITRGIVELFNGRIWVESVLGKGSKFNFSLPKAKDA